MIVFAIVGASIISATVDKNGISYTKNFVHSEGKINTKIRIIYLTD